MFQKWAAISSSWSHVQRWQLWIGHCQRPVCFAGAFGTKANEVSCFVVQKAQFILNEQLKFSLYIQNHRNCYKVLILDCHSSTFRLWPLLLSTTITNLRLAFLTSLTCLILDPLTLLHCSTIVLMWRCCTKQMNNDKLTI